MEMPTRRLLMAFFPLEGVLMLTPAEESAEVVPLAPAVQAQRALRQSAAAKKRQNARFFMVMYSFVIGSLYSKE